jgi:hypothetical protein
VSPSGGQASISDTQPAATTPDVPFGTGNKDQVKIWKTGVIDATGPLNKKGCYFVNGPHEQDLVAELDLYVESGTKSFGPPPLKSDECYQVDVGDSCARSSIIPGLIAYEYIGPCQDKCETEWIKLESEPEWGPWSACDEEHDLPKENPLWECYRYREGSQEFTEKEKCTGETRTAIADLIEQESCVCQNQCEEEWSEWEVTDVDSRTGECSPVLRESTGDYPSECQQTIVTIITEQRTEKCTRRVETRQREERETVPCDCPPEGSGCHISNQGAPGDTNFNVVLTNANAHRRHTQATHCPGDIFPPLDCTCANALFLAQQCGDPARGGFTCKDNRN